MTQQQKLILVILSIFAAVILVGAGCLTLVLIRQSITRPLPASAVAAAATSLPSPPLLSTATPRPPDATPTSPGQTQTAAPTPTNTRVVQQTPTPKPSPTSINCLDRIENFEASGVVTNEEIGQYLRAVIPLTHLDRCQKIRYVPHTAETQATPVAGRFIPVFRQISVYPVKDANLTPSDIINTLTHEIGHNVYFNLRIDNPDSIKQWTDLYQHDDGFVSDYARTNELEDFAETYWAYVLQPQLLLSASPAKYEFMRLNVFAGREYR